MHYFSCVSPLLSALRADRAQEKVDRLAAKLRELGIAPDTE